ncbi:hypothetical protein SUTMEG_09480 [Sutterella megalosphaeroides]|uniref:Prephenate/arogenate dehydrogenase domain-containing protein n=1 Tax=Sutterella megalosphaeroides TaxID=2494234 RepID=A0A2Z6IBN1_9BURK|nr:hypothetical protein SUTMEG_09480 [Sutterella megalosphaeroides]
MKAYGEACEAPHEAEALHEVTQEEARSADLASSIDAAKPPVVLVGGAGGMGRILQRLFAADGREVRILEKDDWDRAQDILRGAKLVVVSVPIDVTTDVIARLGPMLDADAVLSDVTSVKRAPVEAMLAAHAGPVAGLHPMFGPDVASLERQVFVYVPARNPEASAWLEELLRKEGASVVTTSAEEHDRAMGIIQALRHFTTYAYGVFLAELHPDLRQIMAMSSPIYRLELEMVGRLFAQDPHLYADIIMANDDNARLIRAYVESLAPELELVLRGDRKAFVERFGRARDYFGTLAYDFMKESGRMLAAVQSERNGHSKARAAR